MKVEIFKSISELFYSRHKKTSLLIMSLASLSSIIFIAALISCGSDSGSSSGNPIISFVDVYDGETYSKDDDINPATAMVDIPLKIRGINVGDNYRIEIFVNAIITVDGSEIPGFEHYTNTMSDNSVIHIVSLFPNANSIKAFLLEGDSTNEIASAEITLNSSCPLLRSSSGIEALISEEQFNQITADARNNPACVEANAEALGLPMENGKPMINGKWYYTYENFRDAMKAITQFAGEGDENTRKLEIAAFFANVAQETGSGQTYGAGCFIQEGSGSAEHSCNFDGCNNDAEVPCYAPDPQEEWNKVCGGDGVGYPGRGPHQLTYKYNYEAYGKDVEKGDMYVKNPDLLTQDPLIGISGSLWFWNRTTPGWGGRMNPPEKPSAHDVMTHKWKPTENDIKGNRTIEGPNRDFGVVINIINGGVECGPNAGSKEKAQNRVNYYRAYAKILGAEIPAMQTDEDLNCANQANFGVCPSVSGYECCYVPYSQQNPCKCHAVDEQGECVPE